MQEYGIHAFQLQPFQGFAHLLVSGGRIQPAGDTGIYLRGNPEGAVQCRQRLAKQAFTFAFVIDIGGVQTVITRIQESRDEFSYLRRKHGLAERHRTQDQVYRFIHCSAPTL